MIQGVLFDMDGVLVDNSAVHLQAFERFCQRYGVTDWDVKIPQLYGRGNDDIMRALLPPEVIARRGLEALAEEKEAIYREIYAPTIRPVAGLRELLAELRAAGIACAVGSSGCRENVEFVLDRCGIGSYFDVRVSGDRVTRCKPDPEIYLTAARELRIEPAHCLVMEDAPAGIEAARRAGMKVVALATSLSREQLEELGTADRIIDDFTRITAAQIAAL